MSSSLLKEITDKYLSKPEGERKALVDKALTSKYAKLKWLPNPGPQTDAYFSLADEVFYGGQAGGGKTALITGLAVNCHERSLILRRVREDAKDIAEQELIARILDGDRSGWNGQDLAYRMGKQHIEFGGCKQLEDRQRYKGKPHDLICFDEIGDFMQGQYQFIIAWNRSATQGQRCRVLATGNPPTTAEGLWVIDYWGPWLDPKHPAYPAPSGQVRWFITDEDERSVEVDGPGEYEVGGEKMSARSRTFIRADLQDNPDLAESGEYARLLDGLPKELRQAYRDGRFDASLNDHPNQMIPTEWVRLAQNRWTEKPPLSIPLCAIALDPAQGGRDDNVIIKRHDAWFSKPVKVPGSETPVGSDMAAVVVKHRKQGAVIVIDCGGGFGNSAYMHLKDQDIPSDLLIAYKGSHESTRRSKDKMLKFHNKRTEIYWMLREALDPESGIDMALPQGQTILADLTTATFSVMRGNVIKMEPKEDLIKRLGRSPGEGDAIAMCWSAGSKAVTHAAGWFASEEHGIRAGRSRPQVQMGRESARRTRRH